MERAPSPSDGVQDVSGIWKALSGREAVIHGGRPVRNCGPPPALFNPALAKFDYHLRHLDEEADELDVDAYLLRDVHLFIEKSSAIYDSEDARCAALRSLVGRLTGPGVVRHDTILKEGALDVLWDTAHPTVVEVIKNELGIGGDASLQAALSYCKIIRSDTVCLPSFHRIPSAD